MSPNEQERSAIYAALIRAESPLERAKRLSRKMVEVDDLVGITERVPCDIIDNELPDARGEMK